MSRNVSSIDYLEVLQNLGRSGTCLLAVFLLFCGGMTQIKYICIKKKLSVHYIGNHSQGDGRTEIMPCDLYIVVDSL